MASTGQLPPLVVVGPRLADRFAGSPSAFVLKRLLRHRAALVSLVFIGLVAIVAAFAPVITGHSYSAMVFAPLAPPSSAHWMGTDSLGRDLWSRVAYGARLSLEVGVGSQVLAAAIGISVGAIAGFAGGVVDTILMRATDVMLSLPTLLFALLFLTVFGSGTRVVLVAIGLASWPVIARVMRSQVLQLKPATFVEAAYSLGCSHRRVLFSHILPNSFGPVIVQVTFGVSQAIFTEAFLSFLGLGEQPPTPSWGRLLVDGFQYVRTSPHLVIFPAVAITLTLLAFNFIGDGLRDALDPQDAR